MHRLPLPRVMTSTLASLSWRAIVCVLASLPLLASCSRDAPPLNPAPDVAPNDPPRARLSQIYVLGDSISDTGNLIGLVDAFVPVLRPRLQSPPARPNGQVFSDKYLGVEYIAAHYGLNLTPAWEPTPNAHAHLSSLDTQAQARIAHHFSRFHAAAPKHVLSTDEHKVVQTLALQHAGGNNYAVANATIQAYPGLVHRFFNRFRLSEQISHYANRPDPAKKSRNALHFVLIGGNDIFYLLGNPDKQNQADDHIALLIDKMEVQIRRLRNMGAQKILIGTTPDIGEIPAFHNTVQQEQATTLSLMLDQGMAARIHEKFDPRHVRYVSVPNLFNRIIKTWPTPLTHVNCTLEQFNLDHFLISDGEVSLTFKNGCDQQRLAKGDFVFFDPWHGTDAVYQKVGRLYIQEIETFMGNGQGGGAH